jgi:hypothetical protein
MIFRDQTFITRIQTAVSVTEALRTCLVTEVTHCTLQVDAEPEVGAGDRNCLLPSVTHCDGSDSQRGRCVSDIECQRHIASRNMPAFPVYILNLFIDVVPVSEVM